MADHQCLIAPVSAAPGLKPSPVIDLTGDDDTDMARALEASLETKTGPQFGPSERPPHPDWQVAVVRSNACPEVLCEQKQV